MTIECNMASNKTYITDASGRSWCGWVYSSKCKSIHWTDFRGKCGAHTEVLVFPLFPVIAGAPDRIKGGARGGDR